ncbi:hypothetical protein BU23DRAFT_119459 [Bimuria novae-zelandiae CBS 107.79]|uniref:Uncharacterized protein n=1 Tax=Bimuria novae-zelandiae CBS 107.79 TaxID=1447943 RepID=A0A6A5VBZ0_9PLEO|nr:hypothetical protein BU23DRAFT_119459 [Bimuria novae-zelandiae CBS 107.79]
MCCTCPLTASVPYPLCGSRDTPCNNTWGAGCRMQGKAQLQLANEYSLQLSCIADVLHWLQSLFSMALHSIRSDLQRVDPRKAARSINHSRGRQIRIQQPPEATYRVGAAKHYNAHREHLLYPCSTQQIANSPLVQLRPLVLQRRTQDSGS